MNVDRNPITTSKLPVCTRFGRPRYAPYFFYSIFLTCPSVRESLYLNIKYRMLREGAFRCLNYPSVLNLRLEVEHIIEREVEAVLQASPSSLKTRIILVGNLIDALESDAGWVELYGITGELIVPDTYKEEDEVGELLKKVKQVAIQLN